MTMKPFIKKIISLVMVCFCFISITACGEKECSHSYTSNVTKEATCKEAGVKTYTCDKCGNSYTEDIAKLTTHSYIAEITKEPTSKETGVKTYTCTICNTFYTETIPELPELIFGESTIVRSGSNAGCVIAFKTLSDNKVQCSINDSRTTLKIRLYTGTFGYNTINTSFIYTIKIYELVI